MKKLKIILLCLSLLLSLEMLAQDYVDHVTLLRKNSAMVFAGGGISIPNTTFKETASLRNLNDANLSFYVPLKSFPSWSWGFEGSVGYGFGSKDICPAIEPFQILGQSAPPVVTQKGTGSPKQQNFRIGAGSAVSISLGDKFMLMPSVNAVYNNFSETKCNISQMSEVNGVAYNWDICNQITEKSSGIGILPKLKLMYWFGRFGIWVEGNYMIGQKLKTTTTKLVPEGGQPVQGEFYDVGQMNLPTYQTDIKSTNYSAFGINGGIVIAFGKPKQNPPLSTPTTLDEPTPKSEVVQNNNTNGGEYTFTSQLVKQDNAPKKNCLKIISPSNGSLQSNKESLKILIHNTSKNTEDISIKIYKISKDKNYWSKKENILELMDTENAMYQSVFENKTKDLGFQPITLQGKQNGNVIESSIEKDKLSEGAYKMLVLGSCGVTTSNFTMGASCGTNDAKVMISCKSWVDGKPTFNVSVVFNNVASVSQQCTTQMTGINSSTGVISGVATLPVTIPINGNSATVSFTYTPNLASDVNANFYFTGVWNDGNNNTSNFNKTVDLPKCICDYCEKVLEFDNNTTPNATYNAAGNSLSVHQDWWNMNGIQAIASKAEIISFEREVSDDCMKCDKNWTQWGNFISGKSGTAIGSFGNANNGTSGNTHHTLYFTNPNSYSFDLNISIPPLSTLDCCCEKIKLKIRYSYTFKDKNGECKMCSAVFEYTYQKKVCNTKPPLDPPIKWESTQIDLKNVNLKN